MKGLIYRFSFLMVFTLLCAALTVILFIIGNISEGHWKWDERTYLEYTSAVQIGTHSHTYVEYTSTVQTVCGGGVCVSVMSSVCRCVVVCVMYDRMCVGLWWWCVSVMYVWVCHGGVYV